MLSYTNLKMSQPGVCVAGPSRRRPARGPGPARGHESRATVTRVTDSGSDGAGAGGRLEVAAASEGCLSCRVLRREADLKAVGLTDQSYHFRYNAGVRWRIAIANRIYFQHINLLSICVRLL